MQLKVSGFAFWNIPNYFHITPPLGHLWWLSCFFKGLCICLSTNTTCLYLKWKNKLTPPFNFGVQMCFISCRNTLSEILAGGDDRDDETKNGWLTRTEVPEKNITTQQCWQCFDIFHMIALHFILLIYLDLYHNSTSVSSYLTRLCVRLLCVVYSASE